MSKLVVTCIYIYIIFIIISCKFKIDAPFTIYRELVTLYNHLKYISRVRVQTYFNSRFFQTLLILWTLQRWVTRVQSNSCRIQVLSFLTHVNVKPMWAFLIARRPSSVRPSVCLSDRQSVCKLFTFSSSSLEPLSQFQQNLRQSIFGWRGFKFVQMKNYSILIGG